MNWTGTMTFSSSIQLAGLLLLVTCASGSSQGASQAREREQFQQALDHIREGMTEAEVISILGRPEDIRTERDPGGIGRVHTKEIWCYGAKGHLSFPTLGCVYIDKSGRTQEAFGLSIWSIANRIRNQSPALFAPQVGINPPGSNRHSISVRCVLAFRGRLDATGLDAALSLR